jgi:hypothetical protein
MSDGGGANFKAVLRQVRPGIDVKKRVRAGTAVNQIMAVTSVGSIEYGLFSWRRG